MSFFFRRTTSSKSISEEVEQQVLATPATSKGTPPKPQPRPEAPAGDTSDVAVAEAADATSILKDKAEQAVAAAVQVLAAERDQAGQALGQLLHTSGVLSKADSAQGKEAMERSLEAASPGLGIAGGKEAAEGVGEAEEKEARGVQSGGGDPRKVAGSVAQVLGGVGVGLATEDGGEAAVEQVAEVGGADSVGMPSEADSGRSGGPAVGAEVLPAAVPPEGQAEMADLFDAAWGGGASLLAGLHPPASGGPGAGGGKKGSKSEANGAIQGTLAESAGSAAGSEQPSKRASGKKPIMAITLDDASGRVGEAVNVAYTDVGLIPQGKRVEGNDLTSSALKPGGAEVAESEAERAVKGEAEIAAGGTLITRALEEELESVSRAQAAGGEASGVSGIPAVKLLEGLGAAELPSTALGPVGSGKAGVFEAGGEAGLVAPKDPAPPPLDQGPSLAGPPSGRTPDGGGSEAVQSVQAVAAAGGALVGAAGAAVAAALAGRKGAGGTGVSAEAPPLDAKLPYAEVELAGGGGIDGPPGVALASSDKRQVWVSADASKADVGVAGLRAFWEPSGTIPRAGLAGKVEHGAAAAVDGMVGGVNIPSSKVGGAVAAPAGGIAADEKIKVLSATSPDRTVVVGAGESDLSKAALAVGKPGVSKGAVVGAALTGAAEVALAASGGQVPSAGVGGVRPSVTAQAASLESDVPLGSVGVGGNVPSGAIEAPSPSIGGGADFPSAKLGGAQDLSIGGVAIPSAKLGVARAKVDVGPSGSVEAPGEAYPSLSWGQAEGGVSAANASASKASAALRSRGSQPLEAPSVAVAAVPSELDGLPGDSGKDLSAGLLVGAGDVDAGKAGEGVSLPSNNGVKGPAVEPEIPLGKGVVSMGGLDLPVGTRYSLGDTELRGVNTEGVSVDGAAVSGSVSNGTAQVKGDTKARLREIPMSGVGSITKPNVEGIIEPTEVAKTEGENHALSKGAAVTVAAEVAAAAVAARAAVGAEEKGAAAVAKPEGEIHGESKVAGVVGEAGLTAATVIAGASVGAKEKGAAEAVLVKEKGSPVDLAPSGGANAGTLEPVGGRDTLPPKAEGVGVPTAAAAGAGPPKGDSKPAQVKGFAFFTGIGTLLGLGSARQEEDKGSPDLVAGDGLAWETLAGEGASSGAGGDAELGAEGGKLGAPLGEAAAREDTGSGKDDGGGVEDGAGGFVEDGAARIPSFEVAGGASLLPGKVGGEVELPSSKARGGMDAAPGLGEVPPPKGAGQESGIDAGVASVLAIPAGGEPVGGSLDKAVEGSLDAPSISIGASAVEEEASEPAEAAKPAKEKAGVSKGAAAAATVVAGAAGAAMGVMGAKRAVGAKPPPLEAVESPVLAGQAGAGDPLGKAGVPGGELEVAPSKANVPSDKVKGVGGPPGTVGASVGALSGAVVAPAGKVETGVGLDETDGGGDGETVLSEVTGEVVAGAMGGGSPATGGEKDWPAAAVGSDLPAVSLGHDAAAEDRTADEESREAAPKSDVTVGTFAVYAGAVAEAGADPGKLFGTGQSGADTGAHGPAAMIGAVAPAVDTETAARHGRQPSAMRQGNSTAAGVARAGIRVPIPEDGGVAGEAEGEGQGQGPVLKDAGAASGVRDGKPKLSMLRSTLGAGDKAGLAGTGEEESSGSVASGRKDAKGSSLVRNDRTTVLGASGKPKGSGEGRRGPFRLQEGAWLVGDKEATEKDSHAPTNGGPAVMVEGPPAGEEKGGGAVSIGKKASTKERAVVVAVEEKAAAKKYGVGRDESMADDGDGEMLCFCIPIGSKRAGRAKNGLEN